MKKKVNIENVNLLCGTDTIEISPNVPYNNLVCDFLNELSNVLRNYPNVKDYPDVVSFSFWCRKSNLKYLKDKFDDSSLRVGLGLVFHITPSNVPVNFAFSFVFGLLSGNSNIVRVPTKEYPEVDIICKCIQTVFEDKRYKIIKGRNSFIRYDKNDYVTQYYNQDCNARLIWGGDETIFTMKKMDTLPRCIDIMFSNRTSLAVLNPVEILKLSEKDLDVLINKFYNDTYLMDQNACSSPFLVVWLSDNYQGKYRFWKRLAEFVDNKYKLDLINSVDKYTLLCEQAIELNNVKEYYNYGNNLYILNIDKLSNKIQNYKGKFGHFFEIELNTVDSLSNIITNDYQTLTYFGIPKDTLIDLVIKNHLLGIDRIVPVGESLNIGVIWDGYDIIRTLSRIIEYK